MFRAKNWSRMIRNMPRLEKLSRIDTLIDRKSIYRSIDIYFRKKSISTIVRVFSPGHFLSNELSLIKIRRKFENLSKINTLIDRKSMSIDISIFGRSISIFETNIAGFVFRAQNWSIMICNMAMFENLSKIDTLIDRKSIYRSIDIDFRKKFISTIVKFCLSDISYRMSYHSSKYVQWFFQKSCRHTDRQTDTRKQCHFFTPLPNTFRSVYGASFARSSNSTAGIILCDFDYFGTKISKSLEYIVSNEEMPWAHRQTEAHGDFFPTDCSKFLDFRSLRVPKRNITPLKHFDANFF